MLLKRRERFNSNAKPPAVSVLDMDHSEDAAHGQQEQIFYNHHYGSHCYLPLFIFEGLSGKFITAALRPGKRPTGAGNAAIVKPVLKRLRAVWPENPHHPARRQPLRQPGADATGTGYTPHRFPLWPGRQCRPVAARPKPFRETARQLHATHCELARRNRQTEPSATRIYHDLNYRAKTCPKAFRVVLKAEVMALGDNPRFVVTSLDSPSPESLYRDLYCARGQDDKSAGQPICTRGARRVRYRDIPHDYWIKMIKNDLASDRTSDHRFLANHLRMFFACAAYVLHQTLRTEVLVHTEFAKAQPSTVIVKLFKIAVRVVQYKDRVKLHLPSSCPVKALLHRIFQVPEPVWNS